MEYKTISTNDGKILAKLEEDGRECFSTGDLYDMIKPSEIQKKANAERVRDTQIEKDYILTWILTGVSFRSWDGPLLRKAPSLTPAGG